MKLASLDFNLDADLEKAVRAEVNNGRFESESEFFISAIYELIRDLERQGKATPEGLAILARPLPEIIAELRQALAEKRSQ